MPLGAYANLRTFGLAAMVAAWPDIVDKLTDPPVAAPTLPYGIMTCASITAEIGPGNNTVKRLYSWAFTYVFIPDQSMTQPLDLFKAGKAGALIDLIQVINVGTYGYETLAPSVHLQPPPEVLAEGKNAVTVLWQVYVNEDHHV